MDHTSLKGLQADNDCLLRLTPDECQKLSDFIQTYKNQTVKQEYVDFLEKVQTTIQYFF